MQSIDLNVAFAWVDMISLANCIGVHQHLCACKLHSRSPTRTVMLLFDRGDVIRMKNGSSMLLERKERKSEVVLFPFVITDTDAARTTAALLLHQLS